jgi:hypothetical protein
MYENNLPAKPLLSRREIKQEAGVSFFLPEPTGLRLAKPFGVVENFYAKKRIILPL